MPYVESLQEFSQRHGGRTVRIQGHFLYADGARLTVCEIAPQRIEPPTNPLELLPLKREFCVKRLERAEADFENLKSALLGHTDACGFVVRHEWDAQEYGPGPHWEEGEKALNIIKAAVLKWRAEIARIDEEYAALPQIVASRQHREREEQWRAEQASKEYDRRTKLAAIKI